MAQPWNTSTRLCIALLLFVCRSGSLENEPDCGTQPASLGPGVRIVGGKEAQQGEWPWQGVITYKTTVVCGAGLLRNNWVVTLAQCISENQPSSFDVVMGTNNLVNLSSNAQMKEVLEIFVHPNYVQDSFDYDIALLKTEPFTITDYVRPACVPTQEMAPLFGNGTMCTTAGFGARQENGPIYPVLQEIEVPVVDQEYCRELYSTFPDYPVTDNMICIGNISGGEGVCTGDGPTVSKVDDKWYMVGIPSWYAGCARPGYPAVYSRMTAFEEWLTPIYEDRDPKRKDLECGRQVAPLSPELKIVGGKPAQDGEWPWQAAIYVNNYFDCGASLLTPEWIVTSAHCTPFLNDLSVYLIRMGMLDLTKVSSNEQRKGVSAVYVHPNYTVSGNDWDIALLKLSQPFTITDYVRTICVPTEDMDDFYDVETNCTITGWGHTAEGGSVYPPLQEVTVPVYDQDKCRDAYEPEPVTDNMFCAGYADGGKDSCSGDGGGPVVAKAGDQWFLTGIISWGNGCARPNYPGVNTKVSAFADWMEPIFNGGQPETKPSTCNYDEFLCDDGWCIDYTSKCNGVMNEGCYYNTDEEFCGLQTKYFDPFFSIKLNESSIRDTFTTVSVEECAQLCLEMREYTCMAFDIRNLTCNLASRDFQVVSATDGNTLHFQLEKFPLPGTIITSQMGRIATPRWLPSRTSLTMTDGLYIWILKPDATKANTVFFNFSQIIHGDPATECQDPKTENYLVIRLGEEFDAPILKQYCLYQLPQTLEVKSPVVRLEFYSVNAEKYGFLANFNAYWFCDEDLNTSPGVISSPRYPQDYPTNVKCTTTITAPEDHNVILIINDFLLEYDEFSCPGDYDTLRIYNYDEQELIGVYCGTEIPHEFRSSGKSLYLHFKSDSTVTARGFSASYHFVSNKPEITTEHRTQTASTAAPSTKDPLRRELLKAEQRAHSFMVATYVLLSLLPVVIGVICFAFYYFEKRKGVDLEPVQALPLQVKNQHNRNNGNVNATYQDGYETTHANNNGGAA